MDSFPAKLLTKAKDIPDRATVSKPKGNKLYTIWKSARIYHNDEHGRAVKPETDLKGIYLVGIDPPMLAEISPETVLAYRIPSEMLHAINKSVSAAQTEDVE